MDELGLGIGRETEWLDWTLMDSSFDLMWFGCWE